MIYFATDGNAIKIGRSRNIQARLKDLACGHAGRLSLIASMEGHSKQEHKIHSDLSYFRLSGEWFKDCPQVRAAISNYMRDGVSVESDPPADLGPKSGVVGQCRLAAQILVDRKIKSGLPKMEAYEEVGSEVGVSGHWVRKFIGGDPAVKEPRVSVGVSLLESAGLLVAPAKRTESSGAPAPDAE